LLDSIGNPAAVEQVLSALPLLTRATAVGAVRVRQMTDDGIYCNVNFVEFYPQILWVR
jgi:hypothetical protein